jgi:hypothetical protein
MLPLYLRQNGLNFASTQALGITHPPPPIKANTTVNLRDTESMFRHVSNVDQNDFIVLGLIFSKRNQAEKI